MRKLIVFTPPADSDPHDMEVARCQLDELQRSGADLEALILSPGWHRECFEGDEIIVRLKELS